MAEKIKKTIPWFLIISLIISTVGMGFNFGKLNIKASDLDTSVLVGNVVPAFTVITDDSSTSGSPTNSGSNVTFAATATDGNGDQWKLLVCKTDGTSGTACDGGSGDTWCTSSLVDSGSPASCNYAAVDGDAPSQAWYSYACDSTGCSTPTENTNSPFYVNRAPSFTVFADNSPKDPNTTVTWTSTASDPDSNNVTLYVCKSASFTAPSTCNGGEWCHSSASASNPTCDGTSPRPNGNWEARGYVVDSHGFVASGGSQGTDSVLIVNNVAPSITNTTIQLLDTDGAGDLTLTSANGETQDFLVKFVVTDGNSCKNISDGNEIASAIVNVRMSELAQSACDEVGDNNNNNCYVNAQAGTGGRCFQDETVNACTDNTDTTVGWTCEFPLQYHADATYGTHNPPKASYTWTAAVKATDDDSADTGLVDGSSGNELDEFLAYDITEANIAYGGPLAPGAASADQTVTVKATGNVGLHAEYSGTDMTYSSYHIDMSQQKYDLSSGVAWASMTYTLSGTPTEQEIDCLKTTTTGSPAQKITYFKIKIPTGQIPGSYSGTDTVAGVTGDGADW